MTELRSLLYVSSSRLGEDEAPAEVAAIVELSRHRNARLAVTGALLFTGSLFAQLLEGPPSAVDALMASIERDPRHEDVTIVHDEPLSRRSFADWNLAYSGPSHFVERHVTRLLGDPPADERRRGAAWLITLMREFTQG